MPKIVSGSTLLLLRYVIVLSSFYKSEMFACGKRKGVNL